MQTEYHHLLCVWCLHVLLIHIADARVKTLACRGSYNNPSNWYRGASEDEAGAGQRAGTAMNIEQKEEARRRQGNVPREEVVGQTARAEARQEARRGSAQDRRAARSSTAW